MIALKMRSQEKKVKKTTLILHIFRNRLQIFTIWLWVIRLKVLILVRLYLVWAVTKGLGLSSNGLVRLSTRKK